MAYKLSVYSSRTFREYTLPNENNENWSLPIGRDVLASLSDVELEMEVVEHVWHLRKSKLYNLSYLSTGKEYEGEGLEDQDIISVSFISGEKINIQISKSEQTFSAFSKYDITNLRSITIGRSEENDIAYSATNLVKRSQHAVLTKRDMYWVLEDRSDNGIFVNSNGVRGSKQLEFGDNINIFGLHIVFLNDRIAVNSGIGSVTVNQNVLKPVMEVTQSVIGSETDNIGGKVFFHRSPRQIYKIETNPVEIEAPPQPKQESKRPVLLTIGPSMTMAIPMMLGSGMAILSTRMAGAMGSSFMYTGIITAVSSALIGVTWAIINLRYEKKRNKEEELHRFEAYGEYLIRCSNEIKSKYERNTDYMNKMYPDAITCCAYNENTPSLWNRNASHADYLTYRLGIGDLPFQVPIQIPKERFTMVNDALSERPEMIKKSFETLRDVPVCVDLFCHKLVGIIGGKKKRGALDIMYNIVTQLAVSNCYTDVKTVFIYNSNHNEDDDFRFAKWLPHVWSEDKKTRFVSENKNQASDILYELTNALRIRLENAEHSNKKVVPKPYYILFVEDYELLEGELINSYIGREDESLGLSTVLLVENYEDLPNSCNYVIENDADFQGMYDVTDNIEDRLNIRFDHISSKQMEWMARNLSNIEVNEVEQSGEMPSSLSFFDMYGITRLEELNVLDRWRKNRTYESMKALVGQKAGGANCFLDVHEKYHGPHGLVAGTTGSGKSETLQTYLLSLCINFSPDDVGLFLIDYKGGGMANLFDGLPHVIGQISNLSGNQVRRAMVSIKAENKRRQRIFNEHGVNNINLYTRLYKNNEATIPVPHMFIVIDEFAEMKREEPEFMKELISVAQVGRSLGVHLILATQKPSGTVDDNIWSNSKFRLCLRVQDRQDSNDMLHRPDAAYITQAGRCYLQVGNDELFELFQSGYSGATYDENAGIKTNIALMVGTTGKAALVGNHFKMKQKTEVKKRWITLLLQIVNEALGNRAEQIDEALSDNVILYESILRIFEIMESKGIEYPYSEYNAKRIQSLLESYAAVLKDENITDYVQAVMDHAEKNRQKLPEMKEKTQLDAIVEYLHKVAQTNGYDHNLTLWLPLLPTTLYMDSLKNYRKDFNGKNWGERPEAWSLQIPIGLYDDPVNQAQNTLVLDFAENGHLVLTGLAGSGKSTFLQTALYGLTCNYTPDELNVYILDFSTKMLDSFKRMPHVGGIVYEGEDEKLSKFFTMIRAILADRKKLFQGSNYSQYVRVNGIKLPAIMIVIDNYATFRNKSIEDYDDIMMQLVKEGVGCGIFLMITAGGFGSLEIPNRLADNIRSTISLEMSDKFQYSEVLRQTHLEVLPEVNVKGRGLARVGEEILEYQTALSLEADDDFKRMEAIAELAEQMRGCWNGKCAKAIPEIPEKPVWDEFSELDDVEKMAKETGLLPVGYNALNASIYGVDLSRIYCYLITGKARTGKTNYLKVVACSGLMKGADVVLIDFRGELTAFAEKLSIPLIKTDQELFDFFSALMPDFKERNENKRAIVEKGLTEDEIFEEQCKFKTKMILIANLSEFILHVEKPAEGVGAMKAFVENLLDKGALHNVFWFACHSQEESVNVAGRRSYDLFIRDKRGIHFGGNTSAQRILDFDNISFSEQNKTLKTGIGMIPSNDESADRVVVPLYR